MLGIVLRSRIMRVPSQMQRRAPITCQGVSRSPKLIKVVHQRCPYTAAAATAVIPGNMLTLEFHHPSPESVVLPLPIQPCRKCHSTEENHCHSQTPLSQLNRPLVLRGEQFDRISLYKRVYMAPEYQWFWAAGVICLIVLVRANQ